MNERVMERTTGPRRPRDFQRGAISSGTTSPASPSGEPVGLGELVLYFLHLGAFGFGGPIALAGDMQRDLVGRGWITQEEYLQGLAFAQMMPGPLAGQLAMWIGFIRYGVIGATLTGIVFVLPPFLIVLVVAILYVAYNGLSIVQALFYGIGPVVIAIVALSAVRLARTTVGKELAMWAIFAALMLITIFARAEIAILFALGGLAAEGLAPESVQPERLSAGDLAGAIRIVAFCDLPDEYRRQAPVEQWTDVPPVSDGYKAARDVIHRHVATLLDK